MQQIQHILFICESDTEDRKTAAQLFTTRHSDITQVETYLQARKQIEQHKFSIILFNSTAETCKETIDIAKQLDSVMTNDLRAHCPLFVLIDQTDRDYCEDFIGHGIDGIIFKPLNDASAQVVFDGAEKYRQLKLLVSTGVSSDADQYH